MAYVDGFVVPVPKKNVAAYRKMALKAGKVWMEYGALEYRECAGDDLKSFLPHFKVKAGETIFFSWITYRSRAHRDSVNKKVMTDPRVLGAMEGVMPFDHRRMAYGGFKAVVEL